MASALSKPQMTGNSAIDSMRSRHPPPSDLATDASLREWVFEFDVPLSPSALWSIVSDTSRLNRALGLDEMHFEERDGVLHGRNRSLGLGQEWVEEPWSWVKDSHLTSVRRYSRGMARAVFAAYHLEPRDEGRATRFSVYFAWAPRGWLGGLLLSLGMRWLRRRYEEVVGSLSRTPSLPSLPASVPEPLTPAATARLAELELELRARGLDARAVDRLVELLTHGDELDLDRIAPLERARSYGIDEHVLVETCLHATRLGMLDMRWDVVCPHCRGVRASLPHLGELPTDSRCDVCAVDFRTSEANAVEITFRPHPAIRSVEHRFYCSAEPATKRHIEVQRTLAPGSTELLETTLAPGRHRLRVKGEAQFGFVDVFADRSCVEPLEIRADTLDPEIVTGPRPKLLLVARPAEPTTFVVETPMWTDTALRPGFVLSMQGFRDLFSEEYLAADVQIEVGEQTILFTDIVGSTEFYARNGDPAAFAEVKAHFDTLFAVVARHRGAVVKTIGDATMAAFSSPLDAIAAAERMQEAFGVGSNRSAIRIRVSLHTGSCIAVQFHKGIDYFGGTVNLAAKLQSLANAGQVVLSERTYESTGVRVLLEAENAELEDVRYASAALDGPVAAKRWQVS